MCILIEPKIFNRLLVKYKIFLKHAEMVHPVQYFFSVGNNNTSNRRHRRQEATAANRGGDRRTPSVPLQ